MKKYVWILLFFNQLCAGAMTDDEIQNFVDRGMQIITKDPFSSKEFAKLMDEVGALSKEGSSDSDHYKVFMAVPKNYDKEFSHYYFNKIAESIKKHEAHEAEVKAEQSKASSKKSGKEETKKTEEAAIVRLGSGLAEVATRR